MSLRLIRPFWACCLVFAFAIPAVAQDDNAHEDGTHDDAATPSPTPDARAAKADGALLRGLDKVSGRTTDFQVQVGEAVEYGRLEIRLGECRYPAEDPSSDAYAQLTITDKLENVTRFSGWMIASSPALSALDDARYDVWVISCQR